MDHGWKSCLPCRRRKSKTLSRRETAVAGKISCICGACYKEPVSCRRHRHRAGEEKARSGDSYSGRRGRRSGSSTRTVDDSTRAEPVTTGCAPTVRLRRMRLGPPRRDLATPRRRSRLFNACLSLPAGLPGGRSRRACADTRRPDTQSLAIVMSERPPRRATNDAMVAPR